MCVSVYINLCINLCNNAFIHPPKFKCRHVCVCGKDVRSWCDGLSDRSFMGWMLHTTVFVTPVVENWLEREIAQ